MDLDLRDAVSTIRAAAADARRRRGRIAGALSAVREWLSLLLAVGRGRLGRRIEITTGRAWRPKGRRESLMMRLAHDLRQACRGLIATRGIVAIAAVTLALGIGVNTAVFSVLDSLLFRPVPYADGHRLAQLWSYYAPGKMTLKGRFNAALVTGWRAQTDLFVQVEGSESKSLVFEGPAGADMVSGAVVTPALFTMLGVPASAGRVFVEGDGRPGSNRQAIVSDRFWRERLGRDPAAIGRAIVLDGDRYEVIGIMPATFRYPSDQQEVWLPFDVAHPPSAVSSFEPIVRLRDGLTVADVEMRVDALGAEVNRAFGGDGKSSARVVALGETFDERTNRSLVVLGGAVLCLLLIVCANVANLTLARALSRSRDLAVRVSLGASRASLFRVAFAEHALLGAIGGALALGVAHVTLEAVTGVLPAQMTWNTLNAIDIDGRALAWLVAISMFTVLAFGVPPAVMASRASVASILGLESRAVTGSQLARRLRSTLVIAEVSLSIVLLVGAALMTRSLLKLQAIDIGMDTNGLVAMQIAMPARGYTDVPLRDAFTSDLLARVRRHPGIINASAGSLPPDMPMITVGALEFGDRPGTTAKTLMPVHATWPDYFRTAGIRLLEGRDLREGDVEGAAIISRDFAARHWPGRSAVGARFKVGDASWRTVVGVAAEVRRMSQDDNSREHELYFPHDQVSGVMFGGRLPSTIAEYRTFFVRTTRPAQAARELAALVHEVDSRVIVSKTTLVAHQFAEAIARPRIVFLMMSIFAGVGLVLAAAGLYGVLSHLVSQRQREIGIRLALGASPRDIGRIVMIRGLAMVGVGLGLGLLAALVLVRVMRTLLYEVEPGDPLAVVAVVGLVIGTALVACWRPARQAMRFDPIALLRDN